MEPVFLYPKLKQTGVRLGDKILLEDFNDFLSFLSQNGLASSRATVSSNFSLQNASKRSRWISVSLESSIVINTSQTVLLWPCVCCLHSSLVDGQSGTCSKNHASTMFSTSL